jgi:hypothetical protein
MSGMVAHICNPALRIASLGYMRRPVSKNKTTNKLKKKNPQKITFTIQYEHFTHSSNPHNNPIHKNIIIFASFYKTT